MRGYSRSLILFGEGKTEAVFLSHLYSLYRDALPDTRVNTDWGRGGSPECVTDRLIRSHINLKQHNGALLLLDSDIRISPELEAKIQRHSIQLVLSHPICLEGLCLQLLDDPGPKHGKHDAAKLKRHFQLTYLKTDRKAEYVGKLKQACPKLFSKEQIEKKRLQHPCVDEILTFMGV